MLVGNVLFAVIAILAGFLIIVRAVQEPKKISCALTPQGVVVNQDLFPYNNLTSFWVDTAREPPVLRLQTHRAMIPKLILPLGDEVTAEEIRTYLGPFVHEVPYEHTFSDIVGGWLGF